MKKMLIVLLFGMFIKNVVAGGLCSKGGSCREEQVAEEEQFEEEGDAAERTPLINNLKDPNIPTSCSELRKDTTYYRNLKDQGDTLVGIHINTITVTGDHSYLIDGYYFKVLKRIVNGVEQHIHTNQQKINKCVDIEDKWINDGNTYVPLYFILEPKKGSLIMQRVELIGNLAIEAKDGLKWILKIKNFEDLVLNEDHFQHNQR